MLMVMSIILYAMQLLDVNFQVSFLIELHRAVWNGAAEGLFVGMDTLM